MDKPKIRFEGSRVILISKEYSACELDPLWNSIHACAGTTAGRTRDSGIPVRVKWDNGATNAYRLEDLEVYTGEELIDNPNMAFKRAKKTVKESENPCISINCEEFKDVLDDSDHSTEVKKCLDDFERKKKRR